MLVCSTCARVIAFRSQGWRHADPASRCQSLVVAWPPPLVDDDAQDAA